MLVGWSAKMECKIFLLGNDSSISIAVIPETL